MMVKTQLLSFRRFCALLASVLLLPLLSGCGSASPQVRTGFAFDTVISITYYDSKDSGAVTKVMGRLEYYEKIFSRTDPKSELYAVNARLAEAAEQGLHNIRVPLSADLYRALHLALDYAEITEGAFDPTLGKLLELYDFGGTEHTVPTESQREEILSHCGWQKLETAEVSWTGDVSAYPYQLTVADPQIVIDLGGMAKGFIADRLKEELKAEGVTSAIINLGGNILVIGNKPDGKPYGIGVMKPEAGSSENLAAFKITDASAVTSGSYQRFFEQGGVTYHHILDPATGLPAESSLRSVTVVAENSAVADILSTSFFVMGEDEAVHFLENCTGIDAYFVNEQNVVRKYLSK